MNGQLIHLREYINARFNESELQDLCYDLAVDYESLEGRNKSDKVRELILYLYRRRRLEALIHAVEKYRGESLGLSLEIYEEDESTLSPAKPEKNRIKLPVSPATGVLLAAVALLAVAIVSIWMIGRRAEPGHTDERTASDVSITEATIDHEAEPGQPDVRVGEEESTAECPIQVGPLITGRSRLGLVDHMPVQIETRNPGNVEVTYSWRASCGQMSPSLHTRLFQSTYIAPGYAVSDEITVYVVSASCDVIERTAKVLVTEPADISVPADCVLGTEPVATPASSLLVDPVVLTTYTIQPGDTLFSLARQTNTPVPLLLRYNKQLFQPDRLAIGRTIEIPIPNPDFCPGGQSYFVKEDDTFISIADTFGVSPEVLRDLNNVDADYPLLTHSVICVPSD